MFRSGAYYEIVYFYSPFFYMAWLDIFRTHFSINFMKAIQRIRHNDNAAHFIQNFVLWLAKSESH
jgi:hypothetical protein